MPSVKYLWQKYSMKNSRNFIKYSQSIIFCDKLSHFQFYVFYSRYGIWCTNTARVTQMVNMVTNTRVLISIAAEIIRRLCYSTGIVSMLTSPWRLLWLSLSHEGLDGRHGRSTLDEVGLEDSGWGNGIAAICVECGGMLPIRGESGPSNPEPPALIPAADSPGLIPASMPDLMYCLPLLVLMPWCVRLCWYAACLV